MARPTRNNVDYFPHPVSHGKTMFYMRTKYGNDGYAIWFMLLEKLGEADYHYLDLDDDVQMMFLSSELKVTEITLNEMIKDLVKMGQFNKELWEKESILFNEKLVESFADAYENRKSDPITIKSLLELLSNKQRIEWNKTGKKPDKSPVKGSDNPQTKVKESKGKEINIPPIEEFVKYALEKKPNVNVESVRLKYDAWVENGWKDGNGKPVKNWKSKLLNTLVYLRDQYKPAQKEGRQPNYLPDRPC